VHVRVRAWAIRILIGLLAIMLLTGIYLAFRYEPGGDAVSAVHGAAGLLSVLAALTVAVTTALDEERSTAGVLPAIVVLIVVAGMYVTGPALAYDQVVGPVGEYQGIVDLLDDGVVAISRGTDIVAIDDYKPIMWLHVVALPIALIVMGGAGIWAVRRRERTGEAYQPRHAAGVESAEPVAPAAEPAPTDDVAAPPT
jgi:quinol-cytochrome oxidoreductase complex cytochrome b subunit